MATDRDPYARLAGLMEGLPEAERDAGLCALQDAQDAAQRTEEELHEIAYMASHDLTEPLRMVTSYLQLLDRRAADALDERSREFMFYAVDGAERMKALIDDLLRYSRVGTVGLQTSVVHLDTLLVEVLRDLEPAVADTAATVRTDGELPAILGDRVQLGQLLQNLVANAVKFHPRDRGNTVGIATDRCADGTGWELTVTDDGIGVDPAQAARIWRVFQRLHNREEYAGNGIGLSICRRIAERHGGRIWLTAPASGGSTFHVFLPDDRTPA
ncbi:MAG: integral rane sensor signal transduction histidine kinase [Solirubrobacterales bacterium]|jgi:light-regulated signal transduction histidine kinase (bacteriophytochrome)|nr:integral rane sensor signal transduction histidine kinase [Solirubrobacterales bacterium]